MKQTPTECDHIITHPKSWENGHTSRIIFALQKLVPPFGDKAPSKKTARKQNITKEMRRTQMRAFKKQAAATLKSTKKLSDKKAVVNAPDEYH